MSAPPVAAASDRDLLDRVLALEPAAFALLHRPESGGPGELDVLVGDVSQPPSLADLPLPAGPVPAGKAHHEVLVVLPYRQIAERGFACPDDGAPLVAMGVAEQASVPVREALERIPDLPLDLSGRQLDVGDDEYAETVRRIVADEIGTGEGANFVAKRSFFATISDYSPASALAFFRRLLERERGAYWTFVIHTGDRTLVGATPERHLSLDAGTAVMNPVSGTYRYPPGGPTLPGVLAFLADRKETDELYMVVDEELKMMARICDHGGHAVGPQLKEMARLAHTGYLIKGQTTRDVREILRETMFAPTVTGSPLESACRVIDRYEPGGRGYYSGVAALIGRDAGGRRALDSAILIRTADIGAAGRVRIDVGATLVRHSDPASEVAETHAKAAGLLAALGSGGGFGAHPSVRAALTRRNTGIADFWLGEGGGPAEPVPALAGRRVLVVDAEDTFTAMIDHQLRSLGLSVIVRRLDQPYAVEEYDLVVLGPGPGDPRQVGDPRIDRLRSTVRDLLRTRQPFVAVCLSHQVLSLELRFDLARREVPNQGVQREIDLFGQRRQVGFYNTFAARSGEDSREVDGVGTVAVCRDRRTGEVHALRGPRFASMQFHAESVLTVDGPDIVGGFLREMVAA